MVQHSPSIIFVAYSFPKVSETFIVSKFLGLLERGWDVHVVCEESDLAEWKRFPELSRRPDLRRRVHVPKQHRARWLNALPRLIASARSVARAPRAARRYLRQGWNHYGVRTLRHLISDAELMALKPDLIHFEFGLLAVGKMHLRERLNCGVVVSFRGFDLNYHELENPNYYQEIWDQADALHFLGEDLWQRAQRRGCPAKKIHVLIPPAIDTAFFDPGERRHVAVLGTPERPLRILSVGRLVWKKGHEYAMEAVKLLGEQGVGCEYRIVGEGEHREAVAFARQELGLENVVRLLGAQPRSEVKDQLRWADVFLHAALSEGFCNAVIEAQAMTVPVVCSDADGLPENVADGETGFVVPRRNPQSLADKIRLLAQDSTLRQQMGHAGRQRVLKKFHLSDQIAAFEVLYRQVLFARETPIEGESKSSSGREKLIEPKAGSESIHSRPEAT